MNKGQQTNQSQRKIRCAIYTRTATTQKRDDHHTSLGAQRRAAKTFIARQGWLCLPDRYDDDGCSGLNLDRPGLNRLLAEIQDGKIDRLVVYQLGRLTRSLSDLVTLLAIFKKHNTALRSATENLDHYPILGLKQEAAQ